MEHDVNLASVSRRCLLFRLAAVSILAVRSLQMVPENEPQISRLTQNQKMKVCALPFQFWLGQIRAEPRLSVNC